MTLARIFPHALRLPLFAAVCVLAWAAPSMAAAQSAPSRGLDPADAVLQTRDAQRDEAVAAALGAALEQELGGRRVQMRLQPAKVGMASVRDRLVEGDGAVQIGDSEEWLGFRYRVLYDAVMGNTGYPELHIGGVGMEGRILPNDAGLVRELDERVLALVADEFGHQQARMQLDHIVTVETGSRFLRIDAEGLVDFGPQGTAPARVEGLYDRVSGDWLRVAYALEPVPVPVTPVAPSAVAAPLPKQDAGTLALDKDVGLP